MRQPSSDGPMRSLSTFNCGMDVLTSIIGEGVVLRDAARAGGQKVLCLDGGGVKVGGVWFLAAVAQYDCYALFFCRVWFRLSY